MSKDLNIAIGIPCSWEYLPVQFFHSWIGMMKPKHSVIFGNRGRQDDQRNSIIKQVLEYNDEFSHVLFLDIDHYHHAETIKKLVSHNKPCVSGLSFRRSYPFDPIMFSYDGNKFNNIVNWEENELVKVDAVGAASLLVEVDILKKIKSPWFEMNYKFGNGVVGEDFAFCLKVKELGYDVYIDTSCTNKHIGTLEIDRDTWINNGMKANSSI